MKITFLCPTVMTKSIIEIFVQVSQFLNSQSFSQMSHVVTPCWRVTNVQSAHNDIKRLIKMLRDNMEGADTHNTSQPQPIHHPHTPALGTGDMAASDWSMEDNGGLWLVNTGPGSHGKWRESINYVPLGKYVMCKQINYIWTSVRLTPLPLSAQNVHNYMLNYSVLMSAKILNLLCTFIRIFEVNWIFDDFPSQSRSIPSMYPMWRLILLSQKVVYSLSGAGSNC